MSRISVESRAHRVLRGVRRFHFASEEPTVFNQYKRWLNSVTAPGDPIGVYENPQNVEPKAILVTNRGLLVIGSGSPQWFEFSEVKSIEGPTNKDDDAVIALSLRSGTKTHLAIAGTDARFRDIFSVVRFLDRVLEDRKVS